jgi:altronate dehydratase large subunit
MNEASFSGYLRKDGSVGLRNHLAIIPTVFCVNEVAALLGNKIPGSKPLLHNHGCCELKPDLERVQDILSGLIRNPNVGGCVILSLGCEGISAQDLLDVANQAGKPAFHVQLHEEGGMTKAIKTCMAKIPRLQEEIETTKQESFHVSKLVVGIKCGSSDATSGLVANPTVGHVVDRIIELGGTVIFGETTEIIGAEHILVERCKDDDVKKDLLRIVDDIEQRVKSVGVDMRGSQPTPGNIKGGITTIEEKSLGAISKSGTSPIQGVLKYGELVTGSGLYVMDSPGKEDEIMTGLAASGANLILFTTGGGAPQGFPIVPVIKIASNPKMVQKMAEHIDVDASGIISGLSTVDQLEDTIWSRIFTVASGESTQAEALSYDRNIGIYSREISI